jgi:hypothetical protein
MTTWTKERARQYGRDWYKANRESQLARAKQRHALNPEARRRSWLRCRLLQNYGLTIEQYEALLSQQQYRCKICGVHEDDAPKGRLAIDHCHTSFQVRGLLCNNCNSLLGMAKDRPEVLAAATEYLCASLS